MASFGQFAEPIQGCGSILTAGSKILVGTLPNCATEAPVYTLEADAAAAISDEVVSVTVTSTDVSITEATIRKGTRLTIGTSPIVVTADTDLVVDGATSNNIPVEPLTVAIAIAETGDSWLLLELRAPTDLPLNSADTMVDTTDLASGLQGSEQKTNIALSVTVQAILKADDPAVCIIHEASQSDVETTVVICRTGDIYAIGRAIIGNIQYSGAVKDVVKLQFDVMYQPPYSFTPPANCLDAGELVTLNEQLALAGLPAVV